jgi:hypothetical protein
MANAINPDVHALRGPALTFTADLFHITAWSQK